MTLTSSPTTINRQALLVCFLATLAGCELGHIERNLMRRASLRDIGQKKYPQPDNSPVMN